MTIELTSEQMRKEDRSIAEIIEFIEDFLDVVTEDVDLASGKEDYVKLMYDLLAKIGEQAFFIPQEVTYPEVFEEQDFVLWYSKDESDAAGGKPMFWSHAENKFVSYPNANMVRAWELGKILVDRPNVVMVSPNSARKVDKAWREWVERNVANGNRD